MNKDLTSISLSAGLGGMSKGAAIAGFNMEYQSDIWDLPAIIHEANKIRHDLQADDYCISHGVYQYGTYGDMYKQSLESINEFRTSCNETPFKLGGIHLLTTGSPCQDMSRVNPKRCPTMERNQLMIQQLRVIRRLMPMVAVIEQVDSFLDDKMKAFNKEFFAALKSIESEYRWMRKVMNAKHYGARQSRKRVIFILVRRDLNMLPSLPEPTAVQQSQFVSSYLPHIAGVCMKDVFTSADSVLGTLTRGQVEVLTIDKQLRKATIQEKLAFCNLENLRVLDCGVSNKDIEVMLGNMVQIPFMSAIAKHIRTHILKA